MVVVGFVMEMFSRALLYWTVHGTERYGTLLDGAPSALVLYWTVCIVVA